MQFRIVELTSSLSAKLQLWCVGSFHQLKGLLSAAAAASMIETSDHGVKAKFPHHFFLPSNLSSFHCWIKVFRALFVSADALLYLSAE